MTWCGEPGRGPQTTDRLWAFASTGTTDHRLRVEASADARVDLSRTTVQAVGSDGGLLLVPDVVRRLERPV